MPVSTLDLLETRYGNVLRVSLGAIPAVDLATLNGLASQIDAGGSTLAAGYAVVDRLAVSTTSVATLAYNFFTGATTSQAGLDYLVSPQGPNPANLNAPYYQGFNLENRYINFSVNLGKLGEGASAFSAGYGGLSLSDALVKAYTQIFGAAPDASKVSVLLNDQVPNGLGGMETRAQYFASYGLDGPGGIGTKAAMVGWLLAQAAKEDVGIYAQANDAFLSDLGTDGVAIFHTNLVATYGSSSPPAGAVISVDHGQSVSPTAVDASLRSTPGADVISALAGLDAGQSISAGDGDDKITISGGIAGSVDGGAGDDSAFLTFQTLSRTPQISAVEHIYVNSNSPTLMIDFSSANGVKDIWNVSTTKMAFAAYNIASGVVVGLKNTGGGATFRYLNPVSSAELHLDNVAGGRFGQTSVLGILIDNADETNVAVSNDTGVLAIHVDSDSVMAKISNLNGNTITIDGGGHLAAALLFSTQLGVGFLSGRGLERIDATAAAALDISYYRPTSQQAQIQLSAQNDKIVVDLSNDTNSTFTLGGGADTFTLYDRVGSAQFSNIHLTAGKIDALATITDFSRGLDHLDLGPGILSVTNAQSFVAGASTLEQALTQVVSHGANLTNVFEFAGDTYVYRGGNEGGLRAADGLIKLMGVTGLTVATGAMVGDIHYG